MEETPIAERPENAVAAYIEYDLFRKNRLSTSSDSNGESPAYYSDHVLFKVTITLIVLLNTVAMGVEADYPTAPVWAYTEHFFCSAFFGEAVFKLFELRQDYFKDHWNKLDFVLVAVSVLDTWILSLLGPTINMRSVSILRLLRLVRLIRVLRVTKGCEQLVLVMSGIIEAMQSTFWVSTVLFITIYVSSVFCVGFLGHDYGKDYPGFSVDPADIDELEVMVNFNPSVYFGSMSQTMLTLFNIAILAEWSEVVRPVMIRQPWLIVFFISFTMVVTFGMLNTIIAMIVDSVMDNARQLQLEESQRQIEKKVKILKEIQGLVQVMDTSGDGSVSFEELEQEMAADDSKLRMLMNHSDLKLPMGFSARELLCMLDADGDEILDCREFVQSFYRLVDSGPFQQICLLQTGINSLMQAICKNHKVLRENHRELCTRLERLECARAGEGAQTLANCEAKANVANGVPEGKVEDAPDKRPTFAAERKLQEDTPSQSSLLTFLQALPERLELSLERMERDLEDLLQANLAAVLDRREARRPAQALPLAPGLQESTRPADAPQDPHELFPPPMPKFVPTSPFPRNRFPLGTQAVQVAL